MIVIRPTCRLQFTSHDVDFILDTLCKTEAESSAVLRLLSDPDTCDQILDHDRLFRAALDGTGCLHISTRLYFYLLVRRVLLDTGVEDPTVADYVAEMLSVFGSTRRLRKPLGDASGTFDYLVDLLAAIETMDEAGKFVLRAHLANFTLFFCGIFPHYLEHRRLRKAAPALSYFESVGRASYRNAGDHRLARKYELSGIFHTLSDAFRETRLALNDMSDRLLCIDELDVDEQVKGLLRGGA